MIKDELLTRADLESAKNEIILTIKEIIGQAVPKPRKLLKSKEVQELLKVSSSGLQNMRINHIIPYIKIGGTIYYDYADIISLLDLNKVN